MNLNVNADGGPSATSCFVAYEGSNNVSTLVDAADGTTALNYEYGPFGELLRATGPMAKANPFRFSTKYQDDETDLLYYGRRYYNASMGRWPNRDPIGERGGKNHYAFCCDNPVGFHDFLGHTTYDLTYNNPGFPPVSLQVTPNVSVSGDPCKGGPVNISISFSVDYSEGTDLLTQNNVGFTFDGQSSSPENLNTSTPMTWSNHVSKPLPTCPTGDQSGSETFGATEDKSEILSIIIDWHYTCQCCAATKPFTSSVSLFTISWALKHEQASLPNYFIYLGVFHSDFAGCGRG